MTDTTKNDGFSMAGASTTKFYLSTDATLDAGDTYLGSRAVPSLAAGAINSGSTTFTLPPGIAGTYYIIAKADADNTVAETNEGNNITASKAIQIGADLIVSIDVPGSVVIAGSPIVVPDWTRNGNSAPAGASTTKFFLSTDTSLGAGDILVGSRTVPALPPSTTNSGSTSIAIPSDWADGTYYIIAKADADNAVAEFNENNNTAAGTIRIAKEWRGPDLIVWLDLPGSATAAPLAAGSTISITDITKNDGTVQAGASTTKFYLSSDTTLDAGDIPVGGRVVPPQGPGASSSVSTPLTLPVGIGGAYYILAKADADNAVAEVKEENNITVSTRTIFVGPDLIVWLDLPGASTMVTAGSTISINDVTKNDSSAPAGASTTKFYLSSDTILDASDIPLSSRAIPALAAGAMTSGSTFLTLPSGIAGTYYLIAQADADNVVPEYNEGNNITFSSPIAVGPDLVIANITAASKTGAGFTISFSDTTNNKGAAKAGASTTRFYLSSDMVLDASDIFLGSRAILALAASKSTSGRTAVIIPAATPAGSYYVLAQADANNAVAEASESNNTYAKAIEVLPDLIVSVFAAPSKAYPGSTITVSDTTKNQGAGSSVSTTRFYLSSNTILDPSDIYVGGRVVPALASGGTSDGATSVTIPANLVAGTYYLIAMADADNAVAEFNENNNIRYRTLTIGPDLIVSVLSAPSTGVSGSTITITDTTTIQGSSSVASTTKFYLSTNATLSSGDIFLGSRAIPALALQEANSGSTTITLPAGTAAGSYYIIAQADGGNVVAELVENNNTKASAITISSQ
jgi:subtilase family serine protease